MDIGKWVLAGVFVVATTHLPASATSNGFVDQFRYGNELYETGQYEEALTQYRALVDAGVRDATLFYNVGNTAYKLDDLGKAVLYYERALRLDPRNADASQNLELVRSQLKDRQFVKKQNRLIKALVYLHHKLNASEMFTLASVSYVLMCLVIVLLVFRETRFVSRMYRFGSVLSPGRLLGLTGLQDQLLLIGLLFVVFSTTGMSAYSKIERERKRTEAVVMIGEVDVLASPTDDATLQFKVHEGTMVEIRESRRDWLRIQLPGGLSGWVDARSIERV